MKELFENFYFLFKLRHPKFSRLCYISYSYSDLIYKKDKDKIISDDKINDTKVYGIQKKDNTFMEDDFLENEMSFNLLVKHEFRPEYRGAERAEILEYFVDKFVLEISKQIKIAIEGCGSDKEIHIIFLTPKSCPPFGAKIFDSTIFYSNYTAHKNNNIKIGMRLETVLGSYDSALSINAAYYIRAEKKI